MLVLPDDGMRHSGVASPNDEVDTLPYVLRRALGQRDHDCGVEQGHRVVRCARRGTRIGDAPERQDARVCGRRRCECRHRAPRFTELGLPRTTGV
jgi:hypothetical protein